jgi:hypothetical protein
METMAPTIILRMGHSPCLVRPDPEALGGDCMTQKSSQDDYTFLSIKVESYEAVVGVSRRLHRHRRPFPEGRVDRYPKLADSSRYEGRCRSSPRLDRTRIGYVQKASGDVNIPGHCVV